MIMTYDQMPGQSDIATQMKGKVLHASIALGDTELMASDVPPDRFQPMRSVYVCLSVESDTEAEHIYKILTDGGEVYMPMQETFFATKFGQFRDKFGTSWMVSTRSRWGRRNRSGTGKSSMWSRSLSIAAGQPEDDEAAEECSGDDCVRRMTHHKYMDDGCTGHRARQKHESGRHGAWNQQQEGADDFDDASEVAKPLSDPYLSEECDPWCARVWSNIVESAGQI